MHKVYHAEQLRWHICQHCTRFFTVPFQYRNQSQKYCSPECYHAARKGQPLLANMNGIYKTCEYCGKEYYASAKRSTMQRFCNDTCYLEYQSKNLPPMRTIKCEFCGILIETRSPTQRFCTRKCVDKGKRPKPKTGEYHNCAVCGKEVYITRSRLGLPHYFCSKEHANEWQGRNKIEYTCKTCNKPFRKSASFEEFGNVLYCSPQCAYDDPDRHAMLIALNAAQQRGSQTEPERIGYAILDSLSVEYLPQHVIGGKFCVDAFVPSIGLIIQFDGDYWHCNPAKFKEPDARQRKRMRLDHSQDNYMKACGYAVLRIWESDLLNAPDAVRETIRHMLPPVSQPTLPLDQPLLHNVAE